MARQDFYQTSKTVLSRLTGLGLVYLGEKHGDHVSNCFVGESSLLREAAKLAMIVGAVGISFSLFSPIMSPVLACSFCAFLAGRAMMALSNHNAEKRIDRRLAKRNKVVLLTQ